MDTPHSAFGHLLPQGEKEFILYFRQTPHIHHTFNAANIGQ
jgi:hypothetical protein